MELLDVDFLLRLKKLKKALNKTFKEMSADLNLSISYLSEIFRGEKKPNFEFFRMIIDKYKVNIDWVFNGNGDIFVDKNLNLSPPDKFSDEMETFKEILKFILNDKSLFNELLFRLKYQK
jgi:transcriptional regulator with XRE-family HTH domain